MRDLIKQSVRRLGDAFARAKMPDAMVDTWADRLEPYGQQAVRVLRDAVTWETWPTLGAILGKIHALNASARTTVTAQVLTAEQKRGADKALLRSIVWLHLVKRWQPHDFAGTMFARRMGRDEANYGEFLRAAVLHENWTAESIDEWMQLALAKADRDEKNALPG